MMLTRTDNVFSCLLQDQQHGYEGSKESPVLGAERGKAEDLLQKRSIDKQQHDDQFGKDARYHEPVAEHADPADRFPLRPAGQNIPDLGHDDTRKRHRGCGSVHRA
jgi:hypothetical protein